MRIVLRTALLTSLVLCSMTAVSVRGQGFAVGRAQIDTHTCVLPPSAESWSDPDTWGGTLPAAGDSVTIASGRTVVLATSPPPLKELNVLGRLVIGCSDLVLTVDRIVVTGRFDAGSAPAPHPHRLEIELTESYHSPGDPLALSFEVLAGRLEMHGMPRSRSWLRLAATAPAGTRLIQVEQPVDWKPGESVVLASTDFDFEQAEERVISSVLAAGTVLELDQQLQFTHWGEVETLGVDERGEVALLDRSISVSGPTAALLNQRGGHMRFAGSGSALIRLSWIEFERMGDAGMLGRYPVHFHQLGDASGSYVKALSIHHSFNRSLTLHGTQNVLVTDTLSYETLGHAFFFEDASETGNRLMRNLGLSTRRPPAAQQLVPSDATPATYWIQNTDNTLIGNVAAGSEDYGFWYDIPSAQALAAPPVFNDNVGHSNGQNGFYKSDYNSVPASWGQPGVYDGFVAYKNRGAGISHRTASGVTIWSNARVADNATGVFFASDGLQTDDKSETILIGSVVVGETGNIGTPTSSGELQYGRSLPSPNQTGNALLGHEIYEGHVEVRDTFYANFRAAVIAGQMREAGVFGQTRFDNFWAIDSRNRVSGLSFSDAQRVFLDEPGVPLASGHGSWLIHDQDGSLSGLADVYISANTALLVPASGAIYDPISNAMMVPGIQSGNGYANLRVRVGPGFPAMHIESVSRRTSLDVPFTPNGVTYALNVLVPDDYDISFGGVPGPRTFRVELRFGLPQATTIVAVGYAEPRPSSVKVSGIGAPAAASLSALEAASASGWFYDGTFERLYLKLVLGGSGGSIMDGTEVVLVVTE